MKNNLDTIHFEHKNYEQLTFIGDYQRLPSLPLALEGLGLNHLQEHVDRPNGVHFYQWIQSVKGEGILLLNHQLYSVVPGCGIFLPKDTPHIYYSKTKSWYVNFLCIEGSLVDELFKRLKMTDAGVYQLLDPKKILDIEANIYALAKDPMYENAHEVSKLLYSLCIDLAADIGKIYPQSSLEQNQRIHSVIQFMDEHYHQPIGLDDLAQQVNLTKEYLCQLFKRATGNTIVEYLMGIRIAHAKILLISDLKKNVASIAKECGFSSPSYFSAKFREYEHMTPGEFRLSRR